jgi:hypothetical protein
MTEKSNEYNEFTDHDIFQIMPTSQYELEKFYINYKNVRWIFYTEQYDNCEEELYKIFVSSKGDILYLNQEVLPEGEEDDDDNYDYFELIPRRFDYTNIELSIKDDHDLYKKKLSLENIKLVVNIIDKRLRSKIYKFTTRKI